jgi:hypothetical protein
MENVLAPDVAAPYGEYTPQVLKKIAEITMSEILNTLIISSRIL